MQRGQNNLSRKQFKSDRKNSENFTQVIHKIRETLKGGVTIASITIVNIIL